MPIAKLLQTEAFDPEDLVELTAAFESCLRDLGLTNRADPATELVAVEVIALAKQGIRDSDALREAVLKKYRPPQS